MKLQPSSEPTDLISDESTLNRSISTILEKVCAYVDVQGKNEDRSDVVIKKLSALGARINKSLGKQCTHMVFKEGSLTTYKKAKNPVQENRSGFRNKFMLLLLVAPSIINLDFMNELCLSPN